MAFRLIGIWLRVREEGENEGNKGALSIPWMEHAIYTSFLVMIACCMPLMNVDMSTIKYDASRAQTWAPGRLRRRMTQAIRP